MRILLIGVYPLDQQKSMLRYTELLRRGLESRGHRVKEMHPVPRFGRLWKHGALGKWLGYIDKYLLFPVELSLLGKVVQHAHICDHSSAMYAPRFRAANVSVTCHDLLAIGAAAGDYPVSEVGRRVSWTGKLQQLWIRHNLVRVQKVACVSEATRQALLRAGATGILKTIHNPLPVPFSPADAFRTAEILGKLSVPGDARYFLHVGGNQWYKNRVGVMRIFSKLKKTPTFANSHLVLAGKEWTEEMKSVCAGEGLREWIHPVIDASDNEIEALYSGAEALIFPSLREGFGWPIIEAQSCAALVITSNREPMVEVAGGGAILIDPVDSSKAAATIVDAWPQREAIRRRGMENVRRFSERQFLDAFEMLLFEDEVAPASASVV
jgi:glycosyltransferase involved in cell wall biosynthesis